MLNASQEGMRSSILAMVEEKGNIPPLPDILVRLEPKIEDPKSNISDIAILIETEPILSGRMIQLSKCVFQPGRQQGRKSVAGHYSAGTQNDSRFCLYAGSSQVVHEG